MDAVRAIQDVDDLAAPIVKSGVDAAAPIVKARRRAPVVKQGLEDEVEAAASGLSAAERAALTEEQIRQLAKAGQVGTGWRRRWLRRTRCSESWEGRRRRGRAVRRGPPSARLVGRAANDLLDKQSLSEGTRAALAEGRAAPNSGRPRSWVLTSRCRVDAWTAATCAARAPRSGAANVADAFGSSLGRALAPYAAGLAVLAVALAALRELFAPVEKVARQALSLALLVAVVAFCVDHWDAVYGASGSCRERSRCSLGPSESLALLGGALGTVCMIFYSGLLLYARFARQLMALCIWDHRATVASSIVTMHRLSRPFC